MQTNDPFDRFIQNDLFSSKQVPTCANVHPLIEKALEVLTDEDVASLSAFSNQFAACLPKVAIQLGALDFNPLYVEQGENEAEEPPLLALTPDALLDLLEQIVQLALFVEPVVKVLFNQQAADADNAPDADGTGGEPTP
jgi:hypothetical protein